MDRSVLAHELPMGCSWVIHGFGVWSAGPWVAHGPSMVPTGVIMIHELPSVTYGSPMGLPWATHYFRALVHGSPMGHLCGYSTGRCIESATGLPRARALVHGSPIGDPWLHSASAGVSHELPMGL